MRTDQVSSPAEERALETFFAEHPASRKHFEMVRGYIESLGPVTIAVARTQVSFGVIRKFAWVWLPQMWIRKRSNSSLTLAFAADHWIHGRRIEAAVEPRPGRWTHHLILEKESDFDGRVKTWLREAYALGKADRRRAH
jgi:hypothetical protein